MKQMRYLSLMGMVLCLSVWVVSDHASKGEVDRKSKTAKRIRKVYDRLVPYANAENQTGLTFDWKLTVLRADEVNAMVMPAAK